MLGEIVRWLRKHTTNWLLLEVSFVVLVGILFAVGEAIRQTAFNSLPREATWPTLIISFIVVLNILWLAVLAIRVQDAGQPTHVSYLEAKDAYHDAIAAVRDAESEILAVHNWSMSVPIQVAQRSKEAEEYYKRLLSKAKAGIKYERIMQLPHRELQNTDPPKTELPKLKDFEVLQSHLKECVKLADKYNVKISTCASVFPMSFLLIDKRIALLQVHKFVDKGKEQYYEFHGNIIIVGTTDKAVKNLFQVWRTLEGDSTHKVITTAEEIDALFPPKAQSATTVTSAT